MKVKLINSSEPSNELLAQGINDAQELIAYCARVSNPSNQLNTETSEKLIRYLIKHKHWSPLEMVSACLEIETTRDIARQVRAEEQHDVRHLLGRAVAAQRDAGGVAFLDTVRVVGRDLLRDVADHARVDRAGTDRIHADVLARIIQCHRLRHHPHRALAHHIREGIRPSHH